MSSDLSMCVNGWESEYPKFNKSGNIYESGKISSSVNVVLVFFGQAFAISAKLKQYETTPALQDSFNLVHV